MEGSDMASDILLCNPEGDVARLEDFTECGNLKRKVIGIEKYTDLDPIYSISPPVPWRLLYGDGISYKNRPVVWIVNNTYCTITGFQNKKLIIDYCNNYMNAVEMSLYLNEVNPYT